MKYVVVIFGSGNFCFVVMLFEGEDFNEWVVVNSKL